LTRRAEGGDERAFWSEGAREHLGSVEGEPLRAQVFLGAEVAQIFDVALADDEEMSLPGAKSVEYNGELAGLEDRLRDRCSRGESAHEAGVLVCTELGSHPRELSERRVFLQQNRHGSSSRTNGSGSKRTDSSESMSAARFSSVGR